jgi:hypothetical protein
MARRGRIYHTRLSEAQVGRMAEAAYRQAMQRMRPRTADPVLIRADLILARAYWQRGAFLSNIAAGKRLAEREASCTGA